MYNFKLLLIGLVVMAVVSAVLIPFGLTLVSHECLYEGKCFTNLSPKHDPVFKQGMCYIENGIREPWRINPDGIIVLKGYTKYLVMPRVEADSVSGGDKIGAEEEIASFDSKYHEATCPENWKKHTHRKH